LDDVSARLGVAESGRSIFLGIPVVAQNKSEKAKLTVKHINFYSTDEENRSS
jgi:hypothetical protein